MTQNEVFARNVRKRRHTLGLSQEMLAERAGLTRNYVGNLERGEHSPTLDVVEAIADALKLSPSEMLKE